MSNFLGFDPMMVGSFATILAIIFATFVSEDLACIGVGLLLAAGKIDWLTGLSGCLIGIILGDYGVWLMGYLAGTRVMRWRLTGKILTPERLEKFSHQLCHHGGRMAIVSRFIPGSRVPLFLAAGIVGYCPYRFLSWAAFAALLWTPLFVLSVAFAGEAVSGIGTIGFVLIGVSCFAVVKIVPKLFNSTERAKLGVACTKIGRREFWPAWLFYLPLTPWYLWLSLRYRGFTVWTAANPGIPAGGVVGESKVEILRQLPKRFVIPTYLIPPGERTERLKATLQAIRDHGWTYPLILKPDVGERGAGVKQVRNDVEVENYLNENPAAVIAQPFHHGPFEAGIYYYRHPDQPTGRIFSITDKVFPVLQGDGESTLAQLIWQHPRYRMQAKVFLTRHRSEAGRILDEGEAFPLALAGNHCQGTLFRDGRHLLTEELERTIDEIAQRFDGFFIGRFDVRYSNVERFREGKDLVILELNGVTAESSNLYDPSWWAIRAYGTMFRQWYLLFRIGFENRRRGHRPIGLVNLYSLIRNHYRERKVNSLSD